MDNSKLDQLIKELNNKTEYILSIFGLKYFCIVLYSDKGWFRLFGKGLKWKHESLGLTFSERNGFKKYIKIWKWFISYLK